MSNNEDDQSNVVPLRPNPPNPLEATHTLQGAPYTTPANAIRDVLSAGTFNEACKTGGDVEIRIIARFGDDGCIFHLIEMAPAIRRTVEIPVDTEKCEHHWETPEAGRMRCAKCDLSLTAKEWAQKFATPNVLGPDGKPIR